MNLNLGFIAKTILIHKWFYYQHNPSITVMDWCDKNDFNPFGSFAKHAIYLRTSS